MTKATETTTNKVQTLPIQLWPMIIMVRHFFMRLEYKDTIQIELNRMHCIALFWMQMNLCLS